MAKTRNFRLWMAPKANHAGTYDWAQLTKTVESRPASSFSIFFGFFLGRACLTLQRTPFPNFLEKTHKTARQGPFLAFVNVESEVIHSTNKNFNSKLRWFTKLTWFFLVFWPYAFYIKLLDFFRAGPPLASIKTIIPSGGRTQDLWIRSPTRYPLR